MSIQFLDNLNPHSVGGPNDGLANRLQGHVLAIGVGLLDLGDLVDVLKRDGGGHLVARPATAGLDPSGLLEVPCYGGGLDCELEGVVLEGCDGHGHGRVGLVLLGSCVEVLAERHQVQPILPQRRSHRWCGARPAGRDCEPDRRRNGPPG